MASARLSPPWQTFAMELAQLFKFDSEVHVVYYDDVREVCVYVDTAAKAAALEELLPQKQEFGNVTLCINVVPANGTVASKGSVWETAFSGNGAFSFVRTIKGIFSNNLTYVVFKNKVVQYYNDDLGDIYGQCSTLYQDIAKRIFGERNGVFFCTDVEEPVYESTTKMKGDLSAPLGEWP